MFRQHQVFFLNLMFELFFTYLDNFLVFWMDDLLIYSQTEEEHLKHIQLLFDKFQEARIKLKTSRGKFFKSQIEYLGHLVLGQGTPSMKQKPQAIMDLVPATNITEACHMTGLISYYRKFFPVFTDVM